MKITNAAVVLLAIGLPSPAAFAADVSEEVAELRQLIVEMRDSYEQRISSLEERLDKAERDASGARRDAGEAIEQSSGSSSPNTFNPAIGAILTGTFADVGPGWDEIPGFQPAGEIGTGDSGFAVGEAEVNLQASIDSRFYGNFTLALAEGEAEVEEASLQTTGLPAGLTLVGGRLFSSAGYLNGFHPHADDFVDRPLPYQAFFGGHYAIDGLQARWLAPTAFQDPHNLQARPSLIAATRGAELLICAGADLEIGLLPLLLRRSGNPGIQPGSPGHFLVADFVRRLEIPKSIDRSQGDVHPQGNPHMHLHPRNIERVANALADRLAELDPANAGQYHANLANFLARWDEATYAGSNRRKTFAACGWSRTTRASAISPTGSAWTSSQTSSPSRASRRAARTSRNCLNN